MTTQRELRILTALRSMEALHDMETPHLRKLAAIAAEQKFPAGKIVYQEGDVGQAIYLLQEGEVVIEMEVPGQGYVTVFTVEPGQLFGWSSVFPERRKAARARVAKPTRAVVINASRLLNLFQTDHNLEHAVTQRLTEVVADRVRATRQQLIKAFVPEHA